MATEGSCLCGAVRYEIDRLASPIGFCHCLTCQKAHAAASAPTARVRREHFRWLLGRESVAGYESSDPGMRPVVHIWTSHDVPWLEEVDLPKLAEGFSST